MAQVNEAVDTGDSQKLLAALLLPSAGVDEVLAANASRYLTLLTRLRRRKEQVRSSPGVGLRVTWQASAGDRDSSPLAPVKV